VHIYCPTFLILTRWQQFKKIEMRFKILLLILLVTSGIYAQNDSIQKIRYEVINSLYKNRNVEKFGKVELNENFNPFLGLGSLISQPDFIDKLWGDCADLRKKKGYTYSEVIKQNEISKMSNQISWFHTYKKIDSRKISNKIMLVKDIQNNKPTITLPLIYNNKAIVYFTNKNNYEVLLVLIKEKEEWIERCRKVLYQRTDD
jgi:hypothetical protein